MDNIILRPEAKITPFLQNLIMELARKHPDWSFISQSPIEASLFTVVHTPTDIQLGSIKAERKYVNGERTSIFLIDNWRIEAMRERGSGAHTSKPKQAIKLVEKYFYPLTTQEQIEDLYRQAHNFIHVETVDAQHKLSASIRALHQPMLAFAHKHWDTFIGSLNEKDQSEALNLLEHQQLTNSTKALFKKIENKKCLTVYLTDGKYMVQQGEVLQDYESETLPEHIKTKVGLLKLVGERQVVPEVGVRVGDLYVVLP